MGDNVSDRAMLFSVVGHKYCQIISLRLTNKILRKYSETELSNQQIDNVSIILCPHKLLHVDGDENENYSAAKTASNTSCNQHLEVVSTKV